MSNIHKMITRSKNDEVIVQPEGSTSAIVESVRREETVVKQPMNVEAQPELRGETEEVYFDSPLSPESQVLISFNDEGANSPRNSLVTQNAQMIRDVKNELAEHAACFDRITNALVSLKVQMDNLSGLVTARDSRFDSERYNSARTSAYTQQAASQMMYHSPTQYQKLNQLGAENRAIHDKQTGSLMQQPTGIDRSYAEIAAGQSNLFPDSPQCVSGNIAGMLPSFQNDKSDLYEAERFIAALRALAEEHRLGPVRTRYLLESKLGNKAKQIYYDGLGMDDDLTIQARLFEFVKLFTKAPKAKEQHTLFFSCVFLPGENVTQFKLRLNGLMNKAQSTLAPTPEVRESLLLTQFRKGLPPVLGWELARANLHTYEESTEYARKVEDNFRTGSGKYSMTNAVQSEDDVTVNALQELTKEIKKLASAQGQVPVVNSRTEIECRQCKQKGHIARFCRNRPVDDQSSAVCARCSKQGHNESTCRVVLMSSDVSGTDNLNWAAPR